MNSALLALMGGKTYSLLRNLTSPDDPATKGFDAIVKLLDNHLSPKPLVIAERFRFHKRDMASTKDPQKCSDGSGGLRHAPLLEQDLLLPV